jgi:hypothetical protein
MATVKASHVRMLSERLSLIFGGRANLVRVWARVGVGVGVGVKVGVGVGVRLGLGLC